MPSRWTADDIPDQSGRVAVVTGANSGIGLVTARDLARAGARVILACRSANKADAAVATIRGAVPGAQLAVHALDLSDLASVRGFAARLSGEHEAVDVLVNNAGVMAPPAGKTTDGFETQFGTNHLGHFALTGLLLPNLLAAREPRVVTLSSGMHRVGKINFDDLQSERGYNSWMAYSQSKLANLMFCFELARRAALAGTKLLSAAAHPGYSETNLQFAGPRKLEQPLLWLGNKLVAQSADMGALPSLYAATHPDLPNGAFVGPNGLFEGRGYPHIVTGKKSAYDEDAWRRLWAVSEELTGVAYRFGAAAVGEPLVESSEP
jgi:NAD(P)-dependent dehydrogenase (short-subunit alcohol dehydrogenase family)